MKYNKYFLLIFFTPKNKQISDTLQVILTSLLDLYF